jgi:phosphatidylserine/phosphatidylglycerophosphate/cardiolipin synthase-like enzyme
LSEVSTEELRQLAAAISDGKLSLPLSQSSLSFQGFGHLVQVMAPFFGLSKEPLLALVQSVLAERRRFLGKKLDLVWSGSDAGTSYTRYTKIVVPELIDSARNRVTVAGYSFDGGAGIFEAQHQAMNERSVAVRFFLDIEQLCERLEQKLRADKQRRSRLDPLRQAKSAGPEQYAREVLSLFRELYWPYEGKAPDLFYDPRTADRRVFASLHAKCLIVDDERVLITSANFTGRGQERNIEVGALIYDRGYAGALEHQWNNLVESGDVVRG